jgi:hypothetical protein
MDADDFAVPERLERQVVFLEANPDVGLLGSACQEIDTSGRIQGIRQVSTSDLQIRWECLLSNPFLHPTVVMRREVLVAHGLNYDETFEASQDYDLWTRMLKYTRGANLGTPLVRYRLTHGVTSTKRGVQLKNHDLIAFRAIREQLPEFTITRDQVSQLRALFIGGNEELLPIEHRAGLVRVYLDMFAAFLALHAREPGLKTLKRSEALRVARQISRASLRLHELGLVWGLLKMNPILFWLAFRRWLSRVQAIVRCA